MFNFGRENTGLVAKWWRNVDKEILFLFVFLFLLGLFFSFSSTSSMVAEKMNKQTYFFFLKHLVFVCISLSLLIAISIQDKKKLIKVFVGGSVMSGKNILWRLFDGHTKIISNIQHNNMGSFILSEQCKEVFLCFVN